MDVDSLHALLSLRAGVNGQLAISQARLADELGTTKLVVHRVIQRMLADGRLHELPGAQQRYNRTYEVVKPRVWLAARSAPT